MPVARRRFRTTGATVPLGRVRRAGRPPGAVPLLAVTLLACRLACAADGPAAAPSAGRLLVAGELAAERGWFAAAREHWHAAVAVAAHARDAATEARAAAKLSRLDAVTREFAQAAEGRHDESALAWSAAEWRPSWRVASARCSAPGEGTPPVITGRLVVWSTGRAVHAVSLADGTAAWSAGDDRDTRVYPRGVGARGEAGRVAGTNGCAATPVTVSIDGRGFAVLARRRAGDLLVCLDLADSAEGRLAWSAAAGDLPRSAGVAPDAVTFDGPPAIDGEICAAVLRTEDPRGNLTLAVFDARDGSLRWCRDLGPALPVAGDDHPPVRRQPCLAEDRIVVDTHAGTVHAFDRDGAAVWTAPCASSTRGSGAATCTVPARFVAGRLLLCAADGSAITAVEPRNGSQLWRWRADAARVTAVLGVAAGGVVIATRGGGEGTPTTLRRLTIDEGRQTAEVAAGERDAGRGAVTDGTVFWPVVHRSSSGIDDVRIDVLDAVTLQRRREPVDCRWPAQAANAPTPPVAVRIVVAGDALVVADDAITCMRPASDRGRSANSAR